MSDERSTNAIDRLLGQRVRARRLELGMSQEKLAHLLGVTFQQVQKYEKGVNRIAASRLFDIASHLEMPISQFYQDVAPGSGRDGTHPELINKVLATTDGVAFLKLFAEIKHPRVRKRLLNLARAVVKDE